MDREDLFFTPRIAETRDAHQRTLPIRGRLYLACGAVDIGSAGEVAFAHLLGRLATNLDLAMRSKLSEETRAAYRWELRLLGLRSDRDPIAELASDRPDPILVRVATRRAPQLLAIPDVQEEVQREAAERDLPLVVPEEPAPAESFLAGLVRRVKALVVPPAPPPDTDLTGALQAALSQMKLTGKPVERVIEVPRGRPVRFLSEERAVAINTRHKLVRALAKDPARVLFLLVAAVSEINRELEAVTDAEELAVLRDLLRERD
jgi:hypothetical protein